MKIFIGQSRLQAYNILVGNYDLCDKYKFSPTKFIKARKIVVHSKINKLINKNLGLSFFKEFITKQRLNIYNFKKLNFLKKFVITLRKSFFHFYIETLLSFFLTKRKPKTVMSIDYQYINLLVSFDISHLFREQLSERLNF